MNSPGIIWPTSHTWFWLALGLLPLAFVSYSTWRKGFREALNLRTVGVVFIWTGYHLNPWLTAISKQDWNNFLLVESCIDDALLFSALGMLCYLVGFDLVQRFGAKPPGTNRELVDIPGIPPLVLLAAIVFSLLLLYLSVGDLQEIWRSSRARGEGQFEERLGVQKLIQVLLVLSTPAAVFTACLGALMFLNRKVSAGLRWGLGLAGIMAASCHSMFFLSRGSGFAFMLLGFLTLRLRGRRGLVLAVLTGIFGFYLCWVGLQARNERYPGLGNFVDAAIQMPFQDRTDANSSESRAITDQNPLSAIESWTRKAEEREISRAGEEGLEWKFFWVLHPFPSELVPVSYLGRGLSEVMGTVGTLGLTTPMLADFYYVFGFAGVLLLGALGSCYSWFEKRFAQKPSLITLFCLLLCFISIPISLHSWVRSATRPILYAFILLLGLRLYELVTQPPKRVTRRMMPGGSPAPASAPINSNQLT